LLVDKIDNIESVLLCKLSKKIIGELLPTCVTSLSKTIDEIPMMKLKVNKYFLSQCEKNKKINPLYDEIKVKRYIFLNNKDYYLIEEVKEDKLSSVKEITAYKGEQRLSRYPIELEDIGIQLLSNSLDDEIYSLNDLLSEVGWKLDYVDDSVAYDDVENKIEKMRWQQSINTNWLDFIKNELAKQFDCLPLFDTINKRISLVDINTVGEEIKIYLSKDNYLKSKQKTSDGNELITLLKLKGDNKLDMREYIPSGYSFITDFSYFINSNEMSTELIMALNKYEEMVAIRREQWVDLMNEKVEKQTELSLKKTNWLISVSTIDRYKYEVEMYNLNEDEVNSAEATVKLSQEIDNELILRFAIEDILNEIELLEMSISDINMLCKYETCTDENGELVFNEELLDELSEFIFVDEYQDDSFIDGDALIEKGKSVLNEKCKPTIAIDIDSINFMNRIIDNGFRLKWNGELYFGDIIVLIDDETGVEEYFYFIGYDIDYVNNRLTLKISNKKTNRENTKTINKWLKEIKTTKSLLSSNRYLFNDIKNNRLNMDE
jgi:hypothetical protein